ncbi:hypothetical protein BGZ58_000201 [Dissophora ornata]|nr:hypothetical protein BGZ58_000201 [Dissophora ornata]
MSYDSFIKLLDEVFHHDIFKNASYPEQEEVAAQLAVTLDRLGHSGNGMEDTCLGTFWDRSERSCQKYIERVLVALMSLQPRYVTWPTQAQRRAYAARMAMKGFPGCIGFVDGTTIPLSERPAYKADFYYDRHGRSHKHDVFRNSLLGAHPERYFDEGEYLVADSAYPVSTITVPAFKGPSLSADQIDFNTCVAHVRAISEQCIVM